MHWLVFFLLTVTSAAAQTPDRVATPTAAPPTATVTAAPSRAPAAPAPWLDPTSVSLLLNVLQAVTTLAAVLVALWTVQSSQAAERPWLIAQPQPVPFAVTDPLSPEDTAEVGAQLSIVNYGRTPAWIVDHDVRFAFVQYQSLPKGMPPIETGKRSLHYLPPIKPGEADDRWNLSVVLTPEERQAIESGVGPQHSGLLLYGAVKYRDVFGKVRQHGFSWMYLHVPVSDGTMGRSSWISWNEQCWVLIPGPLFAGLKST